MKISRRDLRKIINSIMNESKKQEINESLRDYITSLFKTKEKKTSQDLGQEEFRQSGNNNIVDDFDFDDSSPGQGTMKRRDFIKTGMALGALGATGGLAGKELGIFDKNMGSTGVSSLQMPYADELLKSQAYDHPVLRHIESYLIENFGETARFYKLHRLEDKDWPDITFPDPGSIKNIGENLEKEIYRTYAEKVRDFIAGKKLKSGEVLSKESLLKISDSDIINNDLFELEDDEENYEIWDLKDEAQDKIRAYKRNSFGRPGEERFVLSEKEKSLSRNDEFGVTAAAKILGKRTEAVMGFDAEANLEAYEEFFKLIEPMIEEEASVIIDTPAYRGKFYVVEIQGKKIIFFKDFGLGKIYF